LTGGGDGLGALADSDFLGNEAGPTGLYCFNQVTSGRILIVPGKYSAAVLIGMLAYAEYYRNGSMFCVLDCPPQYTAAQMNAWMDSSGLTELSEFGAIYWPRIKVANPAPDIYGEDNAISIANSGWIAGKYASNDQKLGGVYEAPAGIGGGYGVIPGVLGVEDDPSGGSEHEVLDEAKRDLIAPKRINPIVRFDGTPWHIDGSDTLKSTGNFPSVGERRGVIFIEQTIKAGLLIVKHRFNNPDTRRMVGRIVTRFLIGEMRKGAFRSQNPAEAFFVDVSDQLNPMSAVFAGKLTVRLGLATNKPAKFIIILVTQDTRALQAELEQGR
jgi:phage tail sheath protein FI